MPKSIAWILTLAVLALAAAAGFVAWQGWRTQTTPPLANTFHAVLLVNGQAFFGRLRSLDPEFLVLQEVYYIQSRTNPETKQVANVLVKRGQEWHAPDRMIVNRRHVVLLEPVTEGSQVAKLIAEQAAKK
jgi:hypothetical protein